MTIFERIIAREINAYIIYEDDICVAFLDISQATAGHTLVVPKKAYKDIFEITDAVLSHLMLITKKIAKAIDYTLKPEGINILNNNRSAAGQTVFHFHIHIIPRYTNDDIRFGFTNNASSLTVDDYNKRADAIRVAL